MQLASSNALPALPGLAGIMRYTEKVAASECTVLVTGETGTGKEVIARSIHARSTRSDGPFVSINCAALPDMLVESELFGYERGAFTGASHSHPGKLRQAHKGTVLLDEIGELPLLAQAKLLHVLEMREVSRLGGRRPEPIDVRFIAATNQDLESMVAQKRFRDDLFFRLNVARIHLPPLRERPGDIPALLQHFLLLLGRRNGRSIGALSAAAVECLLRYHWPGNARELRNVAEMLFIDPPQDCIGPEHLPDCVRLLDRAECGERERLIAALSATHWNKCRAAQAMHWSRMTLYRKMHKYQISPKPEALTRLVIDATPSVD
ncbi:MAG: sigma 54-interacting transcriptional regulator [Rhodanobacteraceae bacterium]|nr:sigma 54-interacting transcriptional regulator [Rhodanobacteraceae bacterium]